MGASVAHARLSPGASSSPVGLVVNQLKCTMRSSICGCGFRAICLAKLLSLAWAARFCRTMRMNASRTTARVHDSHHELRVFVRTLPCGHNVVVVHVQRSSLRQPTTTTTTNHLKIFSSPTVHLLYSLPSCLSQHGNTQTQVPLHSHTIDRHTCWRVRRWPLFLNFHPRTFFLFCQKATTKRFPPSSVTLCSPTNPTQVNTPWRPPTRVREPTGRSSAPPPSPRCGPSSPSTEAFWGRGG
jgi:hypothetical protein